MTRTHAILALVGATAAAAVAALGLVPVAGFLAVGTAIMLAARMAGAPEEAPAATAAPDPEPRAPVAVAPALAPGLARLFLEKLPAPLLIIAGNGRVAYANPAAQAGLPHLRQGGHFAHLIRAPAFVEAVSATLADGEERAFRFTDFQGAERHFEARVARLPEGAAFDDGPQAIVQVEDRTRARRAEQLRSDFIANASHELRTPLASVIGYIETLQNHARDDPQARERFLAIMAREAGRMQRLVDGLMSLSRIEQDEHLRPVETLSLNRIAQERAAALAPVAARDGVRLEIALPAGGAEVAGDHDQLAQVFANLIENAMKYGGRGSTVTVSVAAASKAHPNRHGITVADDGPGIAREHLHRLTERFYRVNAGGGRAAGGGNGLGLAIVKHILNRHRGRLEIASTLGQGSAFTVWLPRADAEGEAGAEPGLAAGTGA
jgi:two-component system phosphate regulon sensor histidine kinase PhoR